VGLSVSRTAHLFKECFGQTIMQYTLEVRLNLAYTQVQTSASPLGEIARVCGFGSYSYFQRSFLNRFGVSPRDFRNSLSESGM
ncbi:MAG: AraC family transcriptional regulator, partial [Paenibacillus sp.]|nr:AraC family transcriptional regulator [Paenibacillus sp.]